MYDYIVSTGVIVPDTATIKQQIQNIFTGALGDQLSLADNTAQGVAISALTTVLSALVNSNAKLANQINPNIAGGVFLDAIGALSAFYRSPATKSTVAMDLTGVAGTVVTVGSTVATPLGQVFENLSEITLDSSGLASATFTAVNTGPIAAATGTITQIISGVVGWETAINTSPVNPGTDVQKDPSYKVERNNTLAIQGNSSMEAIYSALYNTVGVTSVNILQNRNGFTTVIQGVTLVQNSIYVVIAGGTNYDCAYAIMSTLAPGVNYNNGPGIPQSQEITDPYSGQPYDILFDRPELIPILVKVTVEQTSSVVNPAAVVRKAILDYASGNLSGEPGFVIGYPISCFELSGAVAQESPLLYVVKVEITLASNPTGFSTNAIILQAWQQATVNDAAITVVLV